MRDERVTSAIVILYLESVKNMSLTMAGVGFA
jgi:hypothetical protein